MRRSPRALTIAGSDSGGGAGIQADLKTFAALGVHGSTAITSVTAQNTVAVTAVRDLEPEIIRAQIDAVVADIGVDAAKTGMLHTETIIKTVAEAVRQYRFPLVVDPVMISKSGASLLQPEARSALVKEMMPLARVVTPNLREAETLSGLTIRSLKDAEHAGVAIRKLGPEAVVVKGGHLQTDGKAIDVLVFKDGVRTFEAERLESKTTHGTGCCFSAAIAAELAKGSGIVDAVQAAKQFVTNAIKLGLRVGRGVGPVNPTGWQHEAAERCGIIDDVSEALRILESDERFAFLIPESSTNLVMTTSTARSRDDVAAVPGRIVRLGRAARASSPPAFGGSRHLADLVLVAMEHDPSVRSAINLRLDDKILSACKKLGWTISSYDRTKEPDKVRKMEGMTIKWGTQQAIHGHGGVPDVIFHKGDWGKEPMLVILGRTAVEVASRAVKLADELKEFYQ